MAAGTWWCTRARQWRGLPCGDAYPHHRRDRRQCQRFLPRYNMDFVGDVVVIDNGLGMVVKVLEVGRMPTGLTVAP